MSNANAPFGFRPVMYKNGAPWNGKYNVYYIPVGNSSILYEGDAVTAGGSASADGKYPDIARAAASDVIQGVVIGFGPSPDLMFQIDNLTRRYWPISTAGYAAVIDDPDVIFEIQEDSDGGAIAVTAVGNNADLVATAGSTTTGRSAMSLDSSDVKTATAQLRILRLADHPDNVLGLYARWLCLINEHIYKQAAGL